MRAGWSDWPANKLINKSEAVKWTWREAVMCEGTSVLWALGTVTHALPLHSQEIMAQIIIKKNSTTVFCNIWLVFWWSVQTVLTYYWLVCYLSCAKWFDLIFGVSNAVFICMWLHPMWLDDYEVLVVVCLGHCSGTWTRQLCSS